MSNVTRGAGRNSVSLAALLTLAAALVATSFPTPAAAARSPRPDDRRPGHYIVVYKSSVDHPRGKTRSFERNEGFNARFNYEDALKGFAARLTDNQVDALSASPAVAFVAEDGEVRALDTAPLTAGDSAPKGIRRVEAATTTAVHEASSVNVAVIDTGIDLDHPDLNAVDGKNCVGTGPAEDDNGHGSHVAGTIGAGNNGTGVTGIAPGSKMYAVKVLNSQGSGTWSQIICGIDWVTGTRKDSDPSNDVHVVNMSLGGTGSPVQSCSTTTDAMHKAICNSTAAGVTYVVAAGNSGWDFDYAPEPDLPAAYPEVLTVSAVSDSDGVPGGTGGAPSCRTSEKDDSYASFSNFAATSAGANHTIAAPGTCIFSTTKNGGYTTMSGTSMASPHMAGAVALCLGESGSPGPCSGLTPAQIIQKMRSDAAAHTAATAGYGFAGDPTRPVSGRYYGYLEWVGMAEAAPPPPDTTAPQVTSITPADGSTAIPTSTGVSVTFSEAMNQTAAQGAFSLVRTSDGTPVAGSFVWNGNVMTFNPTSPLGEGTSYTATVGVGATDSAGNNLASESVSTFSTVTNFSSAPATVTVQSGSVRAGGVASLPSDDNVFFQANSTTSKVYTSSWYGTFSGVARSLRSLSVTYSGKSSRDCTQTLSVWNWATNSWVQLDSRTIGTTELKVVRSAPGTLASYVSGAAAEGSLRVRVLCTKTNRNFFTSSDLLRIDYST